jgi:outer membrane protein assembly factor BamB
MREPTTMNRPRFPLVLGVLLSLSLAAGAAEWSRFRGPNGTGASDDKDVPVEWNDKQNIRWKIAIPGKGHSSPVVWGNRLFLQTAAKDGKDRSLLCVDTDKGEILWSKGIPGNPSSMHKLNSLASSTPATDGERVYCLFWDAKDLLLYAYDFKGEVVWKRGDAADKDRSDLGVHEAKATGGQSQHGAGGSPIVYDGKVFFANDKDGASELLAFDAKTGKTLWKADRKPFRICYSVPFVLEKKDAESELIVGSTAGITGYDPKNGHENWNFSWSFKKTKPLRTIGSPIAHQGLVFQNSGDGDGSRDLIAVKLGGKGDVSGTNLAWEKSGFPYVPTLLGFGDYLFAVTDKPGTACCYLAKTGTEVWQERLGSTFTASPILIDGKIYIVDDDGDVFVLEAGPKFKQLARNSLGEGVSATPAVANNCLYIRGNEHLFCIGKPKK